MSDTDQFSDQEILAKTLDGEAANQDYEGQAAVACVIINRAVLKWQGETTARGVCLHPKQFDCWMPGPDRDRIMAATEANDPVYGQCLAIAQDALAGLLQDNTEGATHYYDTSLPKPPYWAVGKEPTAKIGKLIFFNLSQ